MSTSQEERNAHDEAPTAPLMGYDLEHPSKEPQKPSWLTPARAIVAAVLLGMLAVIIVLAVKLNSTSAELAAIEAERAAAEANDVGAFEPALDVCGVRYGQGDVVQIADGGSTLILPGSGTNTEGLPYFRQECVLKNLGAPESFLAQLQNSRALDGNLTGSWANVEASWTYHPNAGLDIILTKN